MEAELQSFDSNDPDAKLICPYFPEHNDIIAKRFPYHVINCRKQWNGRPMVTCPFNARHKVLASLLRNHTVNCPDKKCIEADIAYLQRKNGVHQDGAYRKGYTDLPMYDKIPDCDEDWDTECSHQEAVGYRPYEHSQPPAYARSYQFGGSYVYSNPLDSTNDGINHTERLATHTTTKVPIEHQQSTASVDEQLCETRLPRQLSTAAAIAMGGSNLQQTPTRAKKVHIAANIFGSNEDSGSSPNPEVTKPTAFTQM